MYRIHQLNNENADLPGAYLKREQMLAERRLGFTLTLGIGLIAPGTNHRRLREAFVMDVPNQDCVDYITSNEVLATRDTHQALSLVRDRLGAAQ